MASIWTLQLHSISVRHRVASIVVNPRKEPRFGQSYRIWKGKKRCRGLALKASNDSTPSDEENPIEDEVILVKSDEEAPAPSDMVISRHRVTRLQETIISLPPVIFLVKGFRHSNVAMGLCIAAALMVVVVRVYVARKSRHKRPGSVADLVRRGQLNSDRRGISKSLNYEDPFNNPLVKMNKTKSTVEMCGKVYRLAPVTLTREEQNSHQKRRSRAYQWKRPTIFLKEGDSIPPDVDPDTVRWIPANHPFATTVSDISEDLAQNNVYQKHGVPFRIQAEHEALQKKLEALQNDQKLNNLVIDAGTARNFERPFKSNRKLDGQQVEEKSSNGQTGSTKPESQPNSTSEEQQA